MSYFKNHAINLVNTHFGLRVLADALVSVFIGVYFLQAGMPLWQIFLVWTAIFTLRLLFRPVVLFAIQKYGIKIMLIVGSINYLGIYALLSQVTGLDWWLLAYAVYYALNDPIYWLPYHVYFAQIGNNHESGRHIGAREFITTAARTVAPILSAFIIANFGFHGSFWLAGGISALASLPFIWLPEVHLGERLTTKQAWKTVDRRGMTLFIGDGIWSSGIYFIWPLTLFLLAQDYIIFGGLLALAALLQMLGGLLIGHFIDRGHTKLLYRLAILFAVSIPLLLAGLATSIPAVIAIDVFIAAAMAIYVPTFNTVLYNLSRKSKSSLWFQYFAETGWDIGSIIATAAAAAIVFAGHDIRWALAMTACGVPVFGYVLWQYYEVEHHTLISK